jgi:glycosyltransferase involved in cell wall biosynthesis
LWSDFMAGGVESETRDLKTADLVIVISKQEEATLQARGIHRTLWSPPFVVAAELPDSDRIGMVGSASAFNREGMDWLGAGPAGSPVRVYGELAKFAAPANGFEPIGRYGEAMDPYRQCGIVLMTTTGGMGVQIKSIEALAAGRAIVARRGAMRGIPAGSGAWIEVDTPEEMREAARRLQVDLAARRAQMAAAIAYARTHLDAGKLGMEFKAALLGIARVRT